MLKHCFGLMAWVCLSLHYSCNSTLCITNSSLCSEGSCRRIIHAENILQHYLSSTLTPYMELLVGLHKHLHNLKWNNWRTGMGLLFSVTGGSQDASAVLRCPAAGEEECVDKQVLFSMELSTLRTLGLVKHPFLLKHPMALAAPCLHDYSHLALLYSQTYPAVLLKPFRVCRPLLQSLENCWRTS